MAHEADAGYSMGMAPTALAIAEGGTLIKDALESAPVGPPVHHGAGPRPDR